MSSLSAATGHKTAVPQKPAPEAVDWANRAMSAVLVLRGTPAFTEFFMGQMQKHRDELAKAVLESESLTADEREWKRRMVRQYDKVILSALADAEASAKRIIDANDAAHAQPTR